MTKIVPEQRPNWSRQKVEQILAVAGITDRVALLGVRGYYRDSMGKVGVNDRGIYDDAFFLLTPDGITSYNANTDPSVSRMGIAVLKTGSWRYKLGIHGLSRPRAKQYQALVQAAPVTVIRDDKGPDTGWFGINIHRGSILTTSSEGCQTIHPLQWPVFIASVATAVKRFTQTSLPYLLIESQG